MEECKINLICPECKKILGRRDSSALECPACKTLFAVEGNIVSFLENKGAIAQDINYYQQWQEQADATFKESENYRKYFYSHARLRNIYARLKKFFHAKIEENSGLYLLADYFVARKDIFFKDFFKAKPRGFILDLGCGRGNNLFNRFGYSVGIDFNIDVLRESSYNLLIQGDILKLPFEDGQFDYIVSTDFLEHIPFAKKDIFYRELKRVLKKGGYMAHFVTTDSRVWWFRFAHRYQELFHRYLIEEIGGHYGLEFSSRLIKRVEGYGFKLVHKQKMLWEPWEFILRFGNEYKEKSRRIKFIVDFMQRLMKHDFVFHLVCVPVSIVVRIYEFFMPLDYSNKAGIVFKNF